MGLGFFSLPVPVTDTEYSAVSGEDQKLVTGSRNIQAAVDLGSSKQLEQIFGGSVAAGDIGIYTAEKLYVQDRGEKKQSFVTSNGMQYRVVDEADWTAQAGVRVYLARRHISQGGQ